MVRSRPWHYSKRSKGWASTVPGREVEGRGERTPFGIYTARGPGGGGFRWRQGARPVVLPGAGGRRIMSWGPLLVNLAATGAVVAVLMLGTFGYAMLTKVHAIMDTIWPLGFVLIATVSFFLSAGHGSAGRRLLVLVLTAVWGLRLGAHIFSRNR